MSNAVSVIIPPALREKAKVLRINVSEVCRAALADYVEFVEKESEIGGTRRQAMQPPTTTPIKEGEENVIG